MAIVNQRLTTTQLDAVTVPASKTYAASDPCKQNRCFAALAYQRVKGRGDRNHGTDQFQCPRTRPTEF